MLTRPQNILYRTIWKSFSILIFIVSLTFSGLAQESVSPLKKLISDREAKALFLEYQAFYNDKQYIEDEKANYHVLSNLFAERLEILNDFASGRPEKISTTDYIKFLSEHYTLGLDVKFKNVKVLKESEEEKGIQLIIEYRKVIFGHYDNERIISRNYQERLNLYKEHDGDWKISDIDLIVPPFCSVDLLGSFFLPGFSLNPGSNSTVIAGLKDMDKFSYSHGLTLEFNISDHFSLATGFQFSTYNSSISANTITQDPISLIVNAGANFFYKASGSNITDEIMLSYYTIPLIGKYYFMPTYKVSPFVGLAAEYHISASAESMMQGKSNDGGFSRTTDLDVESYFLSMSIHGGARIQLFKDKIYAMVDVSYSPSLTNVAESEDYIWSPEPQKYNSLLYAYDQVKLNAFGINVGLKIKLK